MRLARDNGGPEQRWRATIAYNSLGPSPGGCPMTFNPNAQLDPSQVTDVRGRSMGGVGRGGGLAVGGGGLGLVIAIIYVLLGGNPGDLIGSTGRGGPPRPRAQN